MSTDHTASGEAERSRIETPEEIEASLRKREEMFERWAKTVTKSARQPMSQNMSAEWRAYIDKVNKSWVEAAMSAVAIKLKELRAEAIAEREAMRKDFELAIAQLRAEFLQAELDREHGVKRSLLRVVPPDSAMIG